MGATIWVKVLEERNYSADNEDHSLMYYNADELDEVCDAAGVRKLSDFMDYTDQEYSHADFDDEADIEDEDEDEVENGGDQGEDDGAARVADPETGLAYGIDDMTWFPAAEGLASLNAMLDWASGEGEPDRAQELVQELEHCIALLKGPASRGGKFHLAIIE